MPPFRPKRAYTRRQRYMRPDLSYQNVWTDFYDPSSHRAGLYHIALRGMSGLAPTSFLPQEPYETKMHYKEWPNAGAFNALGDRRKKYKLAVFGQFPDYVAGRFYRAGPGGYKVPSSVSKDGTMAVSHWFDGFTTLHRFELIPGHDGCFEIFYSSYCQVDELIETAQRTGNYQGITFGQKRDPCDSMYKKFKSAFEPVAQKTPQNANIGVTFRQIMPSEIPNQSKLKNGSGEVGGSPSKDAPNGPLLLLTTDAASAKSCDADTLEPLGVTNQSVLHPSLTGQLSGAHAAHDTSTGEMFNYNLAFGPTPTYKIFSAKPATGEVEILATISESSVKGAYIHSMFCTPSFVILCVWNAFFKPYGLSVLWNRNLMDAMSPFDPESKAIWLVVDRHHQRGVVKRFESPAFFAFHTTNSWEEHSQDGAVDIICELFQFPNTDILHKFYYENLVSDEKNVKVFNASVWSKKGQGGELARYTLPGIPLLKTAIQTTIGTAERMLTIPSPNAGDLQHCNPHYHLRPHRYVWSVLDRGKSSFIDGLGKTDTLTKTCTVWESHGVTPCEPVFIPAPDATAEDEGVILTVAYIGKVDTSVLLCLDARTMKEIGRAEVGTTVGLGFHGTHLSALG